MSEEEKFDELLNSKLSERDFPFDELNWDEAERLIIAQERWTKNFRFILIFSVGLIVGICSMLPFISNTHNSLSDSLTSKSNTNQNIGNQNTTSKYTTQTQKDSIKNTANKDEAPIPVQSALVKKDTRTGTGTINSYNKYPISKASVKDQSSFVAGINNLHHANATNTTLIASARKASTKPEYTATINQQESNSANDLPNVPSTQVTNTAISGGSNSINNADKIAINKAANTAIADNSSSNNTVVSSKSILKNDTAVSAIVSSKKSSVDNTTANSATKLLVDTSARKKDYSNNENLPPMLRGTVPNNGQSDEYPSNIFSIYAGAAYSFGWRNASMDNVGSEANSITPLGGFIFTHYFNSPLSACIGAGYSEVNKLNNTYTGSIIQYDFGQNASVTTVTPQTVYYMAFPVKIQYNLDEKDMVSIGCDYLLLLTTSSTLTTYQQNYFAETASTSEKQNGYTQGFSNSNVQLTLSVNRMLTDRLGISVEYYHDFDYVENNSISGINQYARNNGFRLIISYQLLK